MKQLGSHWTDFQGIRRLGIFLKSVEKMQILLTLNLPTKTIVSQPFNIIK